MRGGKEMQSRATENFGEETVTKIFAKKKKILLNQISHH